MSFYDWYCDLPPSSPQIWGEQTDAGVGRLVQLDLHHRLGSNVPANADAGRALLHRGSLQGREDRGGDAGLRGDFQTLDLWLHPKQGTDAALAMAMGM